MKILIVPIFVIMVGLLQCNKNCKTQYCHWINEIYLRMGSLMADPQAGFINIEPVHLQFQFQSQIQNLLVQSNLLYLILTNGIIFKIDLNNPENINQLSIFPSSHSNANVRIISSFLDPSGTHLIVQSSKNDVFYINQSFKWNQLSKLSKLNSVIRSVHFLPKYVNTNTPSVSAPILIGLSTGIIYETSIDSSNNTQTYLKLVYNLNHPIDNIYGQLNTETTTTATAKEKYNSSFNSYTLIVSSNRKLYQFHLPLPEKLSTSDSNLLSSFKHYNNTQQQQQQLTQSKCLISNSNQDYITFINDQNTLVFNAFNQFDLAHLDQITTELPLKSIKQILSLKYYILVLTDSRLYYFNKLDTSDCGSVSLSSQGLDWENDPILGISQDINSQTYWLYSAYKIYEIILESNNEGMNSSSKLMKIMIQKELFDEALALVDSKNEIHRQIITSAKANYLFHKKKDYFNAVKLYSAVNSPPFESICLNIMDLKTENSNQILISYLTLKMKKLLKSQYMQRRMISSWIVQLYIKELNTKETTNDKSSSPVNQNELIKFIRLYHDKDYFDKETIYQLLLSNNKRSELLEYSKLLNDYQFMISYYIELKDYHSILKILSLEENTSLIYKYATVLIINYPEKTFELWLRLLINNSNNNNNNNNNSKDGELNIIKLLPSILTYDKCYSHKIAPESHQGILFLKNYITESKSKNKTIHNFLLSLLIKYPIHNTDNLILRYLETNKLSSTSLANIPFDTDYILRLCFKFQKFQIIIYIYSMINQYEQAVQLALDHELIEVAIFVADKPNDEKVKKSLWLNISKKLINKVINDDEYLVEYNKLFQSTNTESPTDSTKDNEPSNSSESKIKSVIQFILFKCPILTIKDLLPLFPDFIIIDNFKHEIVTLLESLNRQKQKLTNEMNASLLSNATIKQQIQDYKLDNFKIVEPYESCGLCHRVLVTRKFITYPCAHSFHQDCIVKEILGSNDYKLISQIKSLQKRVSLDKSSVALKKEIDDVVCSKCCLCSDLKINSIELGFGMDSKDSWEL